MPDLSDLITVLVVTSPTASDPSTDALEETIRSTGGRDLSETRLIIGADGVRPEQRALTVAYEKKLDRISHGVEYYAEEIELRRLPAWGHQANVMRMLLAEVTTPLVLFLEHDTPLTPDVAIDWESAAECILSRELDLIRFLHESSPLTEHAHLFIDRTDEPQHFGTMPYLRTVQWSQRPHLAFTQWYRWIIDTYFAPSSRTMIEDVLAGVTTHYWRTYGVEGWARFKCGIYMDPEPTYQRSTHLDGRAGAPKYGMTFAYPGDSQPEGAPYATLARVFE